MQDRQRSAVVKRLLPVAQQLQKQVMKAKPDALVVQRHQKQVGGLQPLDKRLAGR